MFRIALGAAIPAVEMLSEKYAYLGHHGAPVAVLCCCQFNGGQEVLLAVGAQDTYGELAACQDDGLVQVLQHETERRGSVGHGVGAVEYHEPIVAVIVCVDDPDQCGPQFGRHVRRVDRRFKLVVVDGIAEFLDFGDMLPEVVKVESLKPSGLRVMYHADGAAGVNQQQLSVGVVWRLRHSSSLYCCPCKGKYIIPKMP